MGVVGYKLGCILGYAQNTTQLLQMNKKHNRQLLRWRLFNCH